MATLQNLTAVVPSQIDAIADVVSKAIVAVQAPTAAKQQAAQNATNATNALFSAKQSIMVQLANLSEKRQWDADQISDGVKAAIAAHTAKSAKKDTSLTTFASECRRVMHPLAREHVEETFIAVDEKFATEENDEYKPLRQAWSRRYHAVVSSKGVLQAFIDMNPLRNRITALAEEVIRNKAQDAADAARKLKSLVRKLENVYAEFKAPDIADMLAFCNEIDARKLAAFRVHHKPTAKLAASPIKGAADRATAKLAKPEPEDLVDESIDGLIDDDEDLAA